MTSFVDALENDRNWKNSRILEIELYLTKKVIDNRGTGYKPSTGDEDQALRDELLELRKEIGINKDDKEIKV
tara:strand:+ start:842 stop:1057 length:216 start_codon:yes stop_codon:yes gene_type:complete